MTNNIILSSWQEDDTFYWFNSKVKKEKKNELEPKYEIRFNYHLISWNEKKC